MRNTSTTGPAPYLGGALLATIVFALLYLFFVRSHAGQAMDQLSYDGADFGRISVTPFARRMLDSVPIVSVFAGLILTIVISSVRRNWRTLMVAVTVAVAATVAAQLLKYGVLSRPDLGVDGYAGNSFPSGHTTVAAASALVVFLVSSPRTRPIVAGCGTAFAVLAGVATLANQWHRPSDVIAALLGVAFWGCVGGALLAWPWIWSLAGVGRIGEAGPAGAVAGQRATGFGRVLRWIAIPCAAVAGVSFLLTFLLASGESWSTLVAYIGGVSAIVAAGLVIALCGTRLFARLP